MNPIRRSIILAVSLVMAVNCFANDADDLLKAAGIKGGLIVVVGCDDPSLIASLHNNEGCLVQALDTDAAFVEAARKDIHKRGFYGPVSVDRFDGKNLPYVDNLVNMILDPGSLIPDKEIERVLAPRGVLISKEASVQYPVSSIGSGLLQYTKPVPSGIDDWTHYLHNAGNNAVAQDSVVDSPKGIQWYAGPRYCRSHEYDSSVSAQISANGRIFYILDDGPVGVADKSFPQKWSLYARDAFNGVLLWKRPLPGWGWPAWKKDDYGNVDWLTRSSERLRSPVNLPKRLVAVGDRVYVTLGFKAPVSILDAVTGKVIRECKGTEYTDEILCSDGVMVAVTRKDQPGMGLAAGGHKASVGEGVIQKPSTDNLVAVDVESGKILWQISDQSISLGGVAIENGRFFAHTIDDIVCLDLKTGKENWRTKSPSIYGPLFNTSETMIAAGGKVFFSGAKIDAFDGQTGKKIWALESRDRKGPGRYTPPDLFYDNGSVWAGHKSDEVAQGLDPETGKVKQSIELKKLINTWHHYRCYRSKATERYLIWSKQGAEFIDLKGNNNMRNDWLRGACRYGLMPCNGMLYTTPHPCVCFQGVMLSGFNALSPRSSAKTSASISPRLGKGLAFGEIGNWELGIGDSEWAMFRAGPKRDGSVKTSVPSKLSQAWEVQLHGKLTQPVEANGKLYVSEIDTHTLHALDSSTGRKIWSFLAGGPVDTPPTITQVSDSKSQVSLCIFGSSDGCVYNLRASDGALVWKYRVAPADKRIVSDGRIESVWPVHGAVLIQNGVVYAAAGRSSFLDGGIFLCALDPVSGKLLHEANLDGPWPDVEVDNGSGRDTQGALSDVLVGDGTNVYLGHVMFDAKLQQQGVWGDKQLGKAKPAEHLVATFDLLDDSGFNRIRWKYNNAAGQMLVYDSHTIYSATIYTKRVGRSSVYFPGQQYVELAAQPQTSTSKKKGSRKEREKAKFEAANNVNKWHVNIPIYVRAMALAGDTLLVSGMPDEINKKDPLAALEGRTGGPLWAVSTKDGNKVAEYKLDAPPVFDGLIAANGKVYVSLMDGQVLCLGEK